MFSGCKVYAHDPTINAPANRGNSIKFFKTGVGKENKTTHMKPLNILLQENGHKDTQIEYLKVKYWGYDE